MRLRNLTLLTIIICLGSTSVLAKKENDKHKQLQQGLQKKLDRGGSLPPGWQRKLKIGEILDEPVYSQSETVVPLDSEGLLTVRVEGKIIKLIESTREIVEVLDLLNR